MGADLSRVPSVGAPCEKAASMEYITAGESHGPNLTAIVTGVPAGLPVSVDHINSDLARRQAGYGRGGRMAIEKDTVRFGRTIGSPIALEVANRDWENWTGRMAAFGEAPRDLVREVTPRPGHADLVGALRTNTDDCRNILERASARETAARVAAAGVAREFLAALGVESLNNTDENAQKECITVTFKLKNGKVKSRSYELPATDEVFTLKKQIYQSAEYKQKAWSLFALGEVNEGYHRNIVFYTNGDGYNGVGTLSDSQKAQEIIDTLKAETLTHTGDAMPVLRMEFSQQNNDDYYSEGAVCVTDKDVKTLALIKKYANIVPKAVSAKNVKSVALSIYLPDKDCWQGVQVTDKADIDALLKNAISIDVMNLYGSNAMAYGIMQQFARSNVSVTYTDEKGDEWDASAGYTEEDYPKDIIEKYRAQAEKDAENGVESAQDGDVAYTTEVAVG